MIHQEVGYDVITGECKDDFVFTLEKCLCDWVISLEGKCIGECPSDQENNNGYCQCTHGFTLREDGKACECVGGHLSADYLWCVPNCDDATPVVDKDTNTCRKCVEEWDGGDFWDSENKTCVSACPQSHNSDNIC